MVTPQGREGGRAAGGDPAGLRLRSRRLQRDMRLTQKADYAAPQVPGSPAAPRISVCGPAPPPPCPSPPRDPRPSAAVLTRPPTPQQPGDQRLAQSAEMYHYQHQRQQMRCLER